MNRSLPLAVLLLMAALPLRAQQAPGPEELLALNFYVQQQDSTAIEAELRRLRQIYPQWEPPADLGQIVQTEPSREIDDIFALIARSDFQAARAAIASARAKYPGWTVPEDMLALLATGEGQVALDQALEAGNTALALEVASGVPGLLRCDRVNNAWRIAEAQTKDGRPGDSLATYRAILSACGTPSELLSTLEKADKVASADELLTLFAIVADRFPALTRELDPLLARLLAGRGPGPADGPGAVAGTTGTASRATQPPPRRGDGSAPAAAPPSGSGGVSAAAAAGDWARCMALSQGAQAAATVYQRGWCASNLDRPAEAIAAFQTALAGRLDATQRRDARYGMALSYLKMGMTEEAARLNAATEFTRTQRVDIERQILDQRAVRAFKSRKYRQTVGYLDELERVAGGIRRDLAILRAYAYLNSGNRAEARRQFMALNTQMSTRETREGLAAASTE